LISFACSQPRFRRIRLPSSPCTWGGVLTGPLCTQHGAAFLALRTFQHHEHPVGVHAAGPLGFALFPVELAWRPKLRSGRHPSLTGTYTMWCDTRVSLEGWQP
jgi:hypothetical protein